MLIIFTKFNEEYGVNQIVGSKEVEENDISNAKEIGTEIAKTLSDVLNGKVSFIIDTGKGISTKVSDIIHSS
ncbi:hypothetical protein [Brevibacillus brevis]|uniref:hypothetical protein n=1 Tax=Brevibacillus brevis TaxID=1393 RepID=UPI0007D8AAA8|nr:hypothetical protein [Brevibacillus brevis]